LYGRSLLLAGVAASLETCPDVRTLRATTWAEAARLLREQGPDALIFDLNGDSESHILPLLLTNPDLLLIGLDTECNRAVLVSAHEAQSLTVNQIKEIVQRGDAAVRQ
jgi:hypothetical protein